MPAAVADACARLRDELCAILGDDLEALWAYGAVTFPNPPKRLGDVDTHGVLAHSPDSGKARQIDQAQDAIARDTGIEWDSWYVTAADAAGPHPPRHAFRPDAVDTSWALHRAHWLAGRYVLLHGCAPSEIVPSPTWPKLEEGLRSELFFIQGHVAEGRDDAHHAAFSVWNLCRLLYSFETRDVVVSKRAASAWALVHLPECWHDAIRAAGRVYDADARPGDEDVLRAAMTQFAVFVKERVTGPRLP